MLQLARLESGQGLDRQSVEPARLGRRVLDARQIQAQRRQIALHAELGKVRSRSGIPCWWSRPWQPAGQRPRFRPRRQHPGAERRHGGGGYCFRVRDQGPGIPDFALPRIFERFYPAKARQGKKQRPRAQFCHGGGTPAWRPSCSCQSAGRGCWPHSGCPATEDTSHQAHRAGLSCTSSMTTVPVDAHSY